MRYNFRESNTDKSMANGAVYGARGSLEEALQSEQLVRRYSIKRKQYILIFSGA